MIKFTGHSLDAVVSLTVNSDEIVQRLLQRAQSEGRADDTEDVIRRRRTLRRADAAAHRGLPGRGLLLEVDGMGEVDDVTGRILAALDSVPES